MADFGVPTAGQLEKINALAKRTLSKDEVFAFSTKMVGDALLTERYMKLHKSLLELYKIDAKTGVAFMLDHAWAGIQKALVYGRTFDASIKRSDGTVEGETWALHGDTYIVRGKEKDGISTDSIIADIEDGTLFDVSIGFGFETATCSICGGNYYKYSECEHFRGREYDGQLCYIIAKPPGYLMELSGVFDGAYPTAGILSQMSLPEGQSELIQLPDEELKKLPSGIMTYASYGSNSGRLLTYHKKDDLAKGNVFNVGGIVPGGIGTTDLHIDTVISKQMAEDFVQNVRNLSKPKGSDQEMSEPVTYTQEQVDALAKEAVDKAVAEALANAPAVDPPAAPEAFMTQEQATEKLGKELPADKVLTYAKEGMDYMAQLVEDAVAMGVRAQGNDFPAETWKNTFAGMSSQGIKDIMATFEKQAKEEIPTDRQSSSFNQQTIAQTLPDDAFKVGR